MLEIHQIELYNFQFQICYNHSIAFEYFEVIKHFEVVYLFYNYFQQFAWKHKSEYITKLYTFLAD
jgi:hypothetical protein